MRKGLVDGTLFWFIISWILETGGKFMVFDVENHLRESYNNATKLKSDLQE